MGWKIFNGLKKSDINIKDFQKLPQELKDTANNHKANRICVRYYYDYTFKRSIDINAEIIWDRGIPLIIGNTPFEFALLYVDEFTYINSSKDNELTIDACPDYPFGIDKRSDLIRFDGIEYYNNRTEITILDESQIKYYKKKYKFYIPVMINNIPIPIIKLDKADRVLIPIDEKLLKKLQNMTQAFLRMFVRLELLKRTGNKNSGINAFSAIFLILIGVIGGMIIRGFIG